MSQITYEHFMLDDPLFDAEDDNLQDQFSERLYENVPDDDDDL